MNNNQFVIKHLLEKRNALLDEKQKAIAKFDAEILEMESAIDTLGGKRVWTTEPALIYDDENPEYIKQSQEEI